MKRAIITGAAPEPAGPYSQAVVAHGLLFVSGQGPVDPATGDFVTTDFAAQAEQALANLAAVVEASGGSLNDAVKVTVYLSDLALSGEFNEIYARRMPKPWPARSICQSAMVAFDVSVDVVVALGNPFNTPLKSP